jgi:hypothetical protein
MVKNPVSTPNRQLPTPKMPRRWLFCLALGVGNWELGIVITRLSAARLLIARGLGLAVFRPAPPLRFRDSLPRLRRHGPLLPSATRG